MSEPVPFLKRSPTPAETAAKFGDLHPPFDSQAAVVESNRCLSDAYRCPEVHQEDRDGEPPGVCAGDSGCEYFGVKLLARMSGRRAVRGCLRAASLQQAAD